MRLTVQLQSFESELQIPHVAATEGGPPSFRGVFIRAPAILEVGPEVEVLADFPVPSDKIISSVPAVETQEVNFCIVVVFVALLCIDWPSHKSLKFVASLCINLFLFYSSVT